MLHGTAVSKALDRHGWLGLTGQHQFANAAAHVRRVFHFNAAHDFFHECANAAVYRTFFRQHNGRLHHGQNGFRGAGSVGFAYIVGKLVVAFLERQGIAPNGIDGLLVIFCAVERRRHTL